jgi:hypothetical protein
MENITNIRGHTNSIKLNLTKRLYKLFFLLFKTQGLRYDPTIFSYIQQQYYSTV